MSIQTGEGPIRIDPDDAQFNYRGKAVAIKIRQSAVTSILGCLRQADGSWSAVSVDDDIFFNDLHSPEIELATHGSATEFLRKRVLPYLNAWLATVWPAGGEPANALEQIHAAIGGIRFAPQPDGTVTASLP